MRPLVRAGATLAALAVIGLICSRLVFEMTKGTPLEAVLLLSLAVGPSAFGAVIWRSRGRGWMAIASWTLPLAMALAVLALTHEIPALVAAIGGGAGILAGLLMAISDELAEAWCARVHL